VNFPSWIFALNMGNVMVPNFSHVFAYNQ